MKRLVFNVALLFVAGGLTAYCVMGRQTLSNQALAAYKAGDYQKALPLFKQLAARPEVHNDMKQLTIVMSYIVDIQKRLAPAGGSGDKTVAAAGSGAAAGAPETDQAKLMQQALAFALAQKTTPGDPPMGADRVPHKAPKAGERLVMTIKEMANFEYDANKGGPIPADVQALDGSKVRLTGFMLPLKQSEKLQEFALVPSLTSCCFGQPPGVQHVITCRTPEGTGVDFTVDEVDVEGVIHVHVVRDQDYTSEIFRLDVTGVTDKG